MASASSKPTPGAWQGVTRTTARAVRDWNDREAVHVSLDPQGAPSILRYDPRQRAVFATLVAHYWANDGFLQDGNEIFGRVAVIEGIPGVLVHGRHDISGPAVTAWRLHRQWPASRLCIVETEGHGGPESIERMRAAIQSFAIR